MFNCVVEVLSVDNVPSSVYGGRPNLIIQMGLISPPNHHQDTVSPPTADFLPKCKATQRSTVLLHAPTSVTTDEVFRFVGCDEKEMLLVSIHDRDLDTPKGFVGYTQVPVGGPGKMHGLRTFQFTTDLGLLTGDPSSSNVLADPSPTSIQLLWRIDEADTPAAEGLSSRWESQYQQRVQEVYRHSTSRTNTSIEDSVPAHVGGQIEQYQAEPKGATSSSQGVEKHRSYPLPTPLAPLQASSLNTSVADAPANPQVVEQADIGTKENNPYYPYPASMFNVPALSPEKMSAPPASCPTQGQQSTTADAATPNEGGSGGVADVAVDKAAPKRPIRKDACLDGCTALQAILSAPTRCLTAEEEVLVVAYEGPLLACTAGARAEVPQMMSGGSTIGIRHIIGRIPNITPHHGKAHEGAAFFSGSAAATCNSARISTSVLATASCHKSQASLSIAMKPTAASPTSQEQQNLRPKSSTSPTTHAGSILRPTSGNSVLRSRSKSGGPAWEKSLSNQATGVRLTSTSLTSGPARW